jgi:peptidoglycan hydrolase CwlO-like protein
MSWEKNFTKWIGSKKSVVLHTLFFILMFSLIFFGFKADTILLVLTTVVSLEAIYLAIFIQMTVNQNTESLEEVEEDLEDIVEEVGEISEDIDEIQHDVDEIQEDVEEISEDVEEIQHDVDEIEKEADTYEDESKKDQQKLNDIENVLKKLLQEIENLKK